MKQKLRKTKTAICTSDLNYANQSSDIPPDVRHHKYYFNLHLTSESLLKSMTWVGGDVWVRGELSVVSLLYTDGGAGGNAFLGSL